VAGRRKAQDVLDRVVLARRRLAVRAIHRARVRHVRLTIAILVAVVIA